MAESGLDLRAVEARLPPPSEWEDRERTTWALLVHVRALRAALEAAKQPHLVVEDCWYSCPKALDDRGRSQCCHDAISEGPCNCGADQHNAKIDIVLRGAQDPEGGQAQ